MRTVQVVVLLAALGPIPALAQTPAPVSQAVPADAVKVLLDQATYWASQNQPEQAQRALERLLRLQPGTVDALALLGQLQSQRGERVGAEATLARLRQVNPQDPRIGAIEQTLRVGQIDPAGLAEARQLAKDDRAAEAVARYRRLFGGAPAPGPLAVEYYQTLAATPGGWEAARDGLSQLAANPQDSAAQLAYAELLTYRPQTRDEGIRRLAMLAQGGLVATAATTSWRKALEWLPVDIPSIPAYRLYLDRHPDEEIAQRMQAARNPPRTPADEAAIRRSAGFAALEAGRLAEAQQAFSAVLAQTADDPDALGGMGLVRLRQGRSDEARDYLGRAIAADPAGRARWEAALAGASAGEQYANARAQIQRGQYAEAEQLLRGIIARGGNVAAAQGMLADLQARRGDPAAAEASYRAALAGEPGNADLMVGLARVLTQQGREVEAEALLVRAEGAGSRGAAARMRADMLRQRAATMPDTMEKVALLRAAVAANPSDPWTKLDLARALRATGQRIEARSVMAALADSRATDDLRAAALFAAEDERPAEAAAIAARLPAAARGPDLQALMAQAQLQSDIRASMAMAATSRAAARQKLLTLAAAPDPTGGRGTAIARAFAELRDPAGAREALSVALAATRSPTPAQRLAYGGALLAAGDDAGAKLMVASLEGAGLTAAQTAALGRLQAGIAVRGSDALNDDGRTADAYDRLAPALAQDPSDPALNLALARLYQGAQEPRQALGISMAVLSRDPGDLAARHAAVQAAIAVRDFDRARALVRDGQQMAPNDPQVWVMSADLARAEGADRRALQDLRTARGLREQQLGLEAPAAPADVQPVAASPGLAAPGVNPFRRTAALATDAAPQTLPGTPSVDPMLADIDRQSVGLRDALAPKLSLGSGFRVRSGSPGLDQLTDVTVPLELVVMPLGRGRATLTATPTFLTSGSVELDAKSQASFGNGAFGNQPAPASQQAQGVGLAAAYDLAWLHADIGATPLGFPLQNLVGGVELSPLVTDNLRLRTRFERRAMEDSVLSYAGTRDPGNGTTWGGVTRLGGHGQIEYGAGDVTVYAGGGGASVTGTNVQSNSMVEMGGGGSAPVWRSGGDEVRVGLDLVYFGYQHNLRFFSFGQGGYFSPQSYFAALVPVSYTSKGENLTWSVGGSVGYQTYHESSSAVFPNNPAMQSALVSTGGGPTGTVSYPGQNASGPSGTAHGRVEYRINPSLLVGARASYQYTGNWSEFAGTIYARYIFNGAL